MNQVETDRFVRTLAGRSPAQEPSDSVEWESIVRLATEHDLAPWYYNWLKAGTWHPPQATIERLRESYRASAARSMGLFHELGSILRAFHNEGIPIIPLKGACLAETVYGDIALRPMADIDLLVTPTEIPPALRVLQTLGYYSDQPFDPLAEQSISQHMPLLRKAGTVVELHWTIVSPAFESRFTTADLAALWSRAVKVTIAGAPTLMLSPTDLLLHLCVHVASQHRFDGANFRSFVDMFEVSRRFANSIDWTAFTARANEWGIANGVRLALTMAQECTTFLCPSSVIAGLNADSIDPVTLSWVKHKALHGSSSLLKGNVTRLGARRGFRTRIGALREAAFPPRTTMARMYPAPAQSLRILAYYPVRLKDLVTRYHRAIWWVLSRDKGFISDAQKETQLRKYLGWR